MKCAAQDSERLSVIYLSVGSLGTMGCLLEDLDGREFLGVQVSAHGDFTEAAGEPEVLNLVGADVTMQHATRFYV